MGKQTMQNKGIVIITRSDELIIEKKYLKLCRGTKVDISKEFTLNYKFLNQAKGFTSMLDKFSQKKKKLITFSESNFQKPEIPRLLSLYEKESQKLKNEPASSHVLPNPLNYPKNKLSSNEKLKESLINKSMEVFSKLITDLGIEQHSSNPFMSSARGSEASKINRSNFFVTQADQRFHPKTSRSFIPRVKLLRLHIFHQKKFNIYEFIT